VLAEKALLGRIAARLSFTEKSTLLLWL